MHSRTFRLVLLASLTMAALLAPARADDRADPTTLTGKLIMGYQGWFACPGDAAGRGWVHWSSGGAPTVDLLPDVAELPEAERCHTAMVAADGQPVDLFSSQNPATVDRHFAWMQHYGLDGVALQRFATAVLQPRPLAAVDRVLANVRAAAEAHGRVFFVMYDLSGLRPEDYPALLHDWERLEAQGITGSAAYLQHRGHPLLGVWGLGFVHRPQTPDDARALLAGLARVSAPFGGVTVLGGVPAGWRTGTGDADPAPGWQQVWFMLGVISPWTVGRYGDAAGADRFRAATLAPDLPAAAALGADYMPVVFPGFSWANLMLARQLPQKAIRNQIRRDCGRFYWRQVWGALSAGATMLYGAMFDEVDEGTAMFKLAVTPVPSFVALDADGCHLPSDWYLRLAGAATEAVHRRQQPPPDLPLSLPDR
jgi:hypothetical protein